MRQLAEFEVDNVSGGDEMTYGWGVMVGQAVKWYFETMGDVYQPDTYAERVA